MTFTVIGGDLRTAYMSNHFNLIGHTVYTLGCENCKPLNTPNKHQASIEWCCKNSDAYILPLPITKDSIHIYAPFSTENIALSEFFAVADMDKPIFGGMFPKKLFEMASTRGFEIHDIMNDEAFVFDNALITAEAAVVLAIKNCDFCVFGSNVAVAGFGRIGKGLCRILHSMGADITVYARNAKDRCVANMLGYNSADYNDMNVEKSDIIYNTVEKMIFDKNILDQVKSDCLIIDLASNAGGTDFKYASKKGLNCIHALSLPSKYAPKSAGILITDTILRTMRERL